MSSRYPTAVRDGCESMTVKNATRLEGGFTDIKFNYSAAHLLFNYAFERRSLKAFEY